MVIDNDSLYLYNLTLKHSSSFNLSLLGQFLGDKKSQEIVVISSTIQLLKPDVNTGKIEIISTQNALGVVNCIDKLRIIGTQRDLLVLTSDSGNLSILEYKDNKFISNYQIGITKSGFSRINPGEYLLVDPQNRCILVGAIEKNKLIYRIQSNEDGKLELSSPLEVNTKHLLTVNMTALDSEYDNPIFAAIECDYGVYQDDEELYDPQSTPLQLNYYEFDQGLNHIIKRKSKSSIPASASHLIPLPGHIGGVLICCENYLIYDSPNKNIERIYLPIPIRQTSTTSIIINHVLHRLKKNNFFILLQSSNDDLFKLTMDYNNDTEVIEKFNIFYFDTIPASTSLNILKSGFLFANVLNNDKLFYQFEKLGDDSTETIISSIDYPDLESINNIDTANVSFELRGLDNLALVDVIDTLSPITDSSFVEVHSDTSPDPIKQLLTLSSHSYLKSLIHGVPVSTLVTSPLPIIPTDVFTTKLFSKSTNDEYLVITSSLSSKTLVLSIGEVVEEVEESEFVSDQITIGIQQVGTSSIVQIYSNGIKHIKHIKNDDGETIDRKTTDWFPPAGITILKASSNNNQVIIGLSNSEIRYFEIDQSDDQLIEYQDKIELSSPITALTIADSRNVKKSLFAIVGCSDETIQVLSLQPHNCLEILSLQALSSHSTSLLLISDKDGKSTVHIGMDNGLYVRTALDEINGGLSDTRIKYLGSKPVSLSSVSLATIPQAVLAVSSKPWICYNLNESYKVTPLLGTKLSKGVSFISEDIGGEGIVAIDGNDLIIFTIGEEDTVFDQNQDFNIKKLKLRYTPRKLVVDNSSSTATNKVVYIAESDFGVKGPYPSFQSTESTKQEIDEEYFDAFGYAKKLNSWATCIQVVNIVNEEANEIIQSLEFLNDETILSMTKIKFESTGSHEHLIVGTSTNQKFLPNSCDASHLYTFKINPKKQSTLEFIHKTELDEQPVAIISFKGKLLVGMGKYLRLYDLGQKQLLRKSSTNISYLTNITKLVYQGGYRIVIGDARNSIVFAKFDDEENIFIPFADDIVKRQITSLSKLDYNTVIGSDKFGNVFVSRVPPLISQQSDEDWSLVKHQDSYLNGSGSRLDNICEIYLHDIITSFHKGSINMGGQESIIYSGLQGTIGLLLPLASKQEVEFLNKLELTLRKYFNEDDDNLGINLLGRDHLKFRSYYNPVKNIIDGDLIEKFFALPQSTRIKLSREVDRTPKDIEKKISELRNRSAF
ncbi:CPSF A subunit region-domain-containing protein [Scheffersomyces coipomensis]|uniref:CPSF A subunit region-domain-containing protein n=1 Tax=Scheffersomyces coipomensis TaxID=1788519 RepID=UPI00315DFFDA